MRESLRAAFDHCDDAVVVIEAAHQHLFDGRILYINAAFAALTGFSHREIETQPARLILQGASGNVVPGEIPRRLEYRRKDGSEVSIRMAGWRILDVERREYVVLQQRSPEGELDSAQILSTIRRLQSLLISEKDVQVILDEFLSGLMALTGSEHGFCGEVRTDEKGCRYVSTYSIQTRSGNPEVLRFFQASPENRVEFRRAEGLIGRVISQGEPIVANSASSDPRRGGLPHGHPPLAAFAGLPLKARNRTVGVIGLANRPGGYDEALLSKIQPLLDWFASFVEFRLRWDRAKSVGQMFRHGFTNTRDALVITSSNGTIIDWNPATEKLLGYSKGEAAGRNFRSFSELWHSTDFTDALEALKESGYWAKQFTFHNRWGTEIATEADAFTIANRRTLAFMWVIRDVTWRKKTERALQEASDRFDAFARNSTSAFWMAAAETRRVTYASPALKAIAGIEAPYDMSRWEEFVHPDDRADFLAAVSKERTGESVRHKYRIVAPEGRIRWIQAHAFPVRNAEGAVSQLAGLVEDVTELEEANAQIRLALAEKEELLKEIHHRVKNNLQIISSLLSLQAAAESNPEGSAILQESRSRIETIALLHQQLYQSEQLSGIDFSAYLRRLVSKLKELVPSKAETLTFQFDAEPVMLDSQSAVLCGLILNELVSNSLRHAFPDGRNGEIIIRVRKAGKGIVVMSVRDNGVGIPQNLKLGSVNTLGLQLVQRLTRQLKGTISVSRRGGAEVRIKFALQSPHGSALHD